MADSHKGKESPEFRAMRNHLGAQMVLNACVNLEIRTVFICLIELGSGELLKKAVGVKPVMNQVKGIADSIVADESLTEQVSPNPASGTIGSTSKKRKAKSAPQKTKAAKKLQVPKEEGLEVDKFSDDEALEVSFGGETVKMVDSRKRVTSIQDRVVHLDFD